MPGFCEHGNAHYISMKTGKFLTTWTWS